MTNNKPKFYLLPAILLVLICTVLAIYSNTFDSPFILDDHYFVLEDPAKHMTDLNWDAIKTAALEGRPKNRLLPNASFALEYYFHRHQVTGYHLTNIALHLVTGVLLFFFIRLTLSRHGMPPGITETVSLGSIAFLAALLWVVHPAHTQSVTYIYQRMTSMAALFYILSLLLYAMGRGRWRDAGKLTPGSMLALFGCMVSGICAVVSKQNTGMLPIVILLYEWFFFQGVSLSKRQIGWIAGGIAVFCAIAILYLGDNPFHRILDAYTRREFSLLERVMTQWRVVIYYITQFFYPHPSRLNLDHDYPLSYLLPQPPTTLFCLIAIIAMIGLAVYIARRHRLLSFCILWFFINLVIESSVIGIEIIFEHRTYLPFMLIPLFAVCLSFRCVPMVKPAAGALLLVALVFSVWTYQRNLIWRTPVAFWHDSTEKSPNKARPQMCLGVYMAEQKKYDEAMECFRKALAFNPTPRVLANTHNNIGNIMVLTGRFDEAIAHYKICLAMDPKAQNARRNMENVKNFLKTKRNKSQITKQQKF